MLTTFLKLVTKLIVKLCEVLGVLVKYIKEDIYGYTFTPQKVVKE